MLIFSVQCKLYTICEVPYYELKTIMMMMEIKRDNLSLLISYTSTTNYISIESSILINTVKVESV